MSTVLSQLSKTAAENTVAKLAASMEELRDTSGILRQRAANLARQKATADLVSDSEAKTNLLNAEAARTGAIGNYLRDAGKHVPNKEDVQNLLQSPLGSMKANPGLTAGVAGVGALGLGAAAYMAAHHKRRK